MTAAHSGYKATMLVPEALARDLSEAVESAFEAAEIPPSIASFEEPDGRTWRVELYFADRPDEEELVRVIGQVCRAHNQRPPDIAIEALPALDWVSESQKFLKPVRAGRFHLHGSHDPANNDEGIIDLLIDAGQAFGTGQHETTKGCLLMLDRLLAEGFRPGRALDVGCGSGVLAIAIARAWHIPVAAGDCEEAAVSVTAANAEQNRVPVIPAMSEGWGVLPVRSEGTAHEHIHDAAPFDLVVANILTDPLITLAGDIAGCLTAKRGRLILAGLLGRQAERVIEAYAGHGLVEIDRVMLGDWPTLLLGHGPAG